MIFSLVRIIPLNSTLREKCPNTECFLVRIFLYLVSLLYFPKSPYSVQIQENTDQKKLYLNTFHAVLDFVQRPALIQNCILNYFHPFYSIYKTNVNNTAGCIKGLLQTCLVLFNNHSVHFVHFNKETETADSVKRKK